MMARTAASLLLLLVAAPWLAPAPAEASRQSQRSQRAQEAALIEALPAKYQRWLEDVALLITDEERRTFLDLEQDYQREAFIEHFWRVRDPFPGTARNELRDRWYAGLEQARSEFGSLEDERAKMLLLNGPPDGRAEVRCPTLLWPIEVWYYERTPRLPEELLIVFYQPVGRGHYVIWHPTEGVHQLFQMVAGGVLGAGDVELLRRIQRSCGMGADALLGSISRILRYGAMNYALLIQRAQQPQELPSGEWLATFGAYTTDLPPDAAVFPAELSFDFPGRHQTRTVVQGIFQVPVAELREARFGAARSVNLLLTGEILRDGQLLDRFRYKFDFPEEQLRGEKVPLVFQRHLRPGEYRIITRLEDINAKSYHRVERELTVPWVDGMVPAELDAETAVALAEVEASLGALDPAVRILPPFGDMLVGRVRFEAEVTGPEVARVAFALGGQTVLERRSPPWSVSLDLGRLPRTQVLRVAAFSAEGEELAADEMLLNAGSHRFAVRMLEPRAGQRVGETVRVVADVQVPEGERVERLELHVGEELAATLFQPPWDQPVRLPEPGALTYIRTVAYLPDGNSTDQLVFLNAPEGLEHLDVQMVELFATVTDRSGRPVEGLEEGDFRVVEDGVEQTIRRFEKVTDLPFHAAILLDVSGSMEDSLEIAQAAALSFFQKALSPQDRAALFTFNDRPHLAQGFTNDVMQLGGALAGLRAERGTALYDSVITALHHFGGVRGQRALLVLSDGEDTASRFDFAQTLEYARRSGVTIYSIGLKIPRREMGVRRELQRLADETGGRAFFIDDASALAGIYHVIEEELRSQYLIAYQSTNTSRDDRFRTVELEVRRPGLRAQTLRGYYP
jgi:Ca-activated chloride channel homolog